MLKEETIGIVLSVAVKNNTKVSAIIEPQRSISVKKVSLETATKNEKETVNDLKRKRAETELQVKNVMTLMLYRNSRLLRSNL